MKEKEGGGGLFERQMNSYTPPGSLCKSMTWGSLDQKLQVRPFTYSSSADRWNDAIANSVNHLLMFLKMQLSLKKKKGGKKKKKNTNKLVYPEGEHSFPVS